MKRLFGDLTEADVEAMSDDELEAVKQQALGRLTKRKKTRLATALALDTIETGFMITDCFPWAIKSDCDRLDCPMREAVTIPGIRSVSGEPTGNETLLTCTPAGELADFLLTVQRSSAAVQEQTNDQD